MPDNFYVGYDLADAGYSFTCTIPTVESDLTVLDGAVPNFVQLFCLKTDFRFTKAQMFTKLLKTLPHVSLNSTVVVLFLDKEGAMNKKMSVKRVSFIELFFRMIKCTEALKIHPSHWRNEIIKVSQRFINPDKLS
jgi:hypothetical protein